VNQQTRPAFVKQPSAAAARSRAFAVILAALLATVGLASALGPLAGLGAGAQPFADRDGDEPALRTATASAAGP
jgi:hypothetical protein